MDREVVLAAAAQFSFALYHASEELKADREMVLAAVAQHGFALEQAVPVHGEMGKFFPMRTLRSASLNLIVCASG